MDQGAKKRTASFIPHKQRLTSLLMWNHMKYHFIACQLRNDGHYFTFFPVYRFGLALTILR